MSKTAPTAICETQQPLRIPQLEIYAVSPTSGFLPSPNSPPLRALPSYYAPWDGLAASLADLLATNTLRARVRDLPLLPTTHLHSSQEFQRAFVVLGFLVHGYVWCGTLAGDSKPDPVVPPALGEPYLAVCAELGMPQSLAYAGLCLWNWTKVVSKGWELDDMDCLVSFTGTRDEATFYLVPVQVEAEGGRLVSLLLDGIKATAEGEDGAKGVLRALLDVKKTLQRMGALLRNIHQHCDAHVFYHRIRPFLAGGKGMEENGLPCGVVFRRSDCGEVCVKCVGGSAAQSSLFQFIDLALGVVHRPIDGVMGETVFEEMRSYMPRAHRDFLDKVSRLPSLQTYVEGNFASEGLSVAYNECLHELSSWRSKHIGVVTTHIVNPSRKAQGVQEKRGAEEMHDGSYVRDDSKLQGTGGSALVPFLKQAKQETMDACVRDGVRSEERRR